MAYNRWISSNVPYRSVDILHEEEGASDTNAQAENDYYSELLKNYTRFRRGESVELDEEERKRLEEDEQKRREDEERQRVETEEKDNKHVGVLKRISSYLSYNV